MLMGYIVMAYLAMAYIVMTYIVMADIAMTFIVMTVPLSLHRPMPTCLVIILIKTSCRG